MSKPTYAEAWAVCRDDRLLISSIDHTRREAISNFMHMVVGPEWTPKQWRWWKRKGYRASHVSVQEYLFKGDTP